MPLKYELIMDVDETSESVSISGELSDEDVKVLEAFLRETDEVWNTDFVQVGEKGKLDIQWDRESGMTVSTVLPEWDQVVVLLHKFRPILLNDENTNFYKIRNLIAQKLDHPHFRNVLAVQKELYSGKICQAEFQIRSNDVLLNSEKVLLGWLNSHEFHRDEDKREFIESLHKMVPLDVSKVIFLRLLFHKAIAAKNLADFIRVLLGKDKEMNGAMKPVIK